MAKNQAARTAIQHELDAAVNAVYQVIKSNYPSVEDAWEAAHDATLVLAERWGKTDIVAEVERAHAED